MRPNISEQFWTPLTLIRTKAKIRQPHLDSLCNGRKVVAFVDSDLHEKFLEVDWKPESSSVLNSRRVWLQTNVYLCLYASIR